MRGIKPTNYEKSQTPEARMKGRRTLKEGYASGRIVAWSKGKKLKDLFSPEHYAEFIRRSKEIHPRKPLVNCICKYCGKSFFAFQWDVKRGQGKFCSHKCSEDAIKAHLIGCKSSKVEVVCWWCGKKMMVKKGFSIRGGKYCSRKCKGAHMKKMYQTGERTVWNKGVGREEYIARIGEERYKQLVVASTKRLLGLYESGKFPRQSNTKPEIALKEELFRRGYKKGIDFFHQFRFNDKFMCDFAFPHQKIIVECDGDYWHRKPNTKFSKKPFTEAQLRTARIDKSREAYIKKVDGGTWTLLHFWESDIKKDVGACVDKIEAALRR